MESSRYRQAAEEVGVSNAKAQKEEERIQKARQQEEERRARKEAKKRELLGGGVFNLMQTIKRLFDDYYLDAIIGLIPGAGDILSTAPGSIFIYFSLFKVKSIPLTLAVACNYMTDMVLGMIPFFGDLLDCFYKAHRKNLDLIVGYVDDNKEIIDSVNKRAVGFAFLLAVLIMIFVLLVQLVASTWKWIAGLFA